MILRRCSYITSRQALPRKNTKRGGFLDLFGLGQCRNRSNSFDDKVKHVTVVMEPKKKGIVTFVMLKIRTIFKLQIVCHIV